MTDEQRAELRRGIEFLVRMYTVPPPGRSDGMGGVSLDFMASYGHHLANFHGAPPLAGHKKLALAVLLGEDVPLPVLIAACEDAGVFPAGVLAEVERQAYERGKRDGNPLVHLAQQLSVPEQYVAEGFRRLTAAGLTAEFVRRAAASPTT